MFCRTCGHDNGKRSTGKCANCGYDLEFQNLPLKEQRKGLSHRIEAPLDLGDTTFRTHHYKRTGLVGVVAGIICVTVAAYITFTFQRAQVTGEDDNGTAFADTATADLPQDSLPIRVGSDIVYVLNDSGTTAEPRTNLNLSLIPEGSTVAFLGSSTVPIRPLVSFIERKRAEGAAAHLDLNALCCWVDSGRTEFETVHLLVSNPNPPDSTMAPVSLKLFFNYPNPLREVNVDEWIIAKVPEFDIMYQGGVSAGQFNAWKFDSVMTQVTRSLSRRDLGSRPVEVTAVFADNSNLGHAIDIMQTIYPYIDSLGYRGMGLTYFLPPE